MSPPTSCKATRQWLLGPALPTLAVRRQQPFRGRLWRPSRLHRSQSSTAPLSRSPSQISAIRDSKCFYRSRYIPLEPAPPSSRLDNNGPAPGNALHALSRLIAGYDSIAYNSSDYLYAYLTAHHLFRPLSVLISWVHYSPRASVRSKNNIIIYKAALKKRSIFSMREVRVLREQRWQNKHAEGCPRGWCHVTRNGRLRFRL